ncbi:MAG: endonuclease V, partial [Candidatus Geothermarchaeales archaeon]
SACARCSGNAAAISRLLACLKVTPSILIVNAHGTAHPSSAGLACFVGVESPDLATIGVAQRRLCGIPQGEPSEVGSWSFLEYRGRRVGAVLLAVPSGKPIFVSPGHNISIETSVEVVKHFITGFRLPLPLKLAHDVAKRERGENRSRNGAPRSE